MTSETKFNPDWTVAPAEYLKEWREENGLPASWAADALRLLTEVADRKPLGEDHARVLERVTKIPVRMWLSLEREYREGLAAGRKDCEAAEAGPPCPHPAGHITPVAGLSSNGPVSYQLCLVCKARRDTHSAVWGCEICNAGEFHPWRGDCPECHGTGEVEVPEGYCTCGTGPGGYYGAHESGCGSEPCPAGCRYVPPAARGPRP